ncbi:hypothetical protein D3C75_1107870 [compost metagenome]
MAIAVGVLHQIILVVVLRQIIVLQRQDLRYDGFVIFTLLLCHYLLNDFRFFRGCVVDTRTILDASVIALFIDAGRINHPEIIIQQGL